MSDLSKLSDVPTDDLVHGGMAWSLPGNHVEPAPPEYALDEIEEERQERERELGLEVSQFR